MEEMKWRPELILTLATVSFIVLLITGYWSMHTTRDSLLEKSSQCLSSIDWGDYIRHHQIICKI